MPSVAKRELRRHPELVLRILVMRGFVATKDAIDRAQSEADAPDGPMVDIVFEFIAEDLQRRRARRGGERLA